MTDEAKAMIETVRLFQAERDLKEALALERAHKFFWLFQIDETLFPLGTGLPTTENFLLNAGKVLTTKNLDHKQFCEEYLRPCIVSMKNQMVAKEHADSNWPYCSFQCDGSHMILQGFKTCESHFPQ